MEIKEEIKNEIRNYIQLKNINSVLKQLPNRGYHSIEINYEMAVNKKDDKYVFVISQIITYHNGSIDSRTYNIYAFDSNSGKLIEDFEEKGGCYYGFFNDLNIIETIL
jgi:hypothetical protein